MTPGEELIWRCRLNGLKEPNDAHLRIARNIFSLSEDEFDGEDIVTALEQESPRVSGATVFRTLYMLEAVGMLSRDGMRFRRRALDARETDA